MRFAGPLVTEPLQKGSPRTSNDSESFCAPPPPHAPPREGRIGQGGRGRTQGGERPMGTTAYGGKRSKGRAVNGGRPMGAASYGREQPALN